MRRAAFVALMVASAGVLLYGATWGGRSVVYAGVSTLLALGARCVLRA